MIEGALPLAEGAEGVAGADLQTRLLEAGVVDELFLTVSPLLVGRTPLDPRLGLVEGADLLPGGPVRGQLLGLRRDGGHLFLRYALEGA